MNTEMCCGLLCKVMYMKSLWNIAKGHGGIANATLLQRRLMAKIISLM